LKRELGYIECTPARNAAHSNRNRDHKDFRAMTQYNPYYWEVQTDISNLERVPAERALWYETDVDRARKQAMRDFYKEVSPAVNTIIEGALTRRQREIVQLYYIHGKTQEDIASILSVKQSTVSRHLFGTSRGGRKVGGAIPKLRKAIDRRGDPQIARALGSLHSRLAEAV
jgi:RNA polymerase sigma factor (sigma-70 family)